MIEIDKMDNIKFWENEKQNGILKIIKAKKYNIK